MSKRAMSSDVVLKYFNAYNCGGIKILGNGKYFKYKINDTSSFLKYLNLKLIIKKINKIEMIVFHKAFFHAFIFSENEVFV